MFEKPEIRRDRTEVMDTLSSLLSPLRLRTYKFGALDAGGNWALEFGSYSGIKVCAVVKGDCWLEVNGEQALNASVGDAVLLTAGRPFRVAASRKGLDGPANPPVRIVAGQVGRLNGGGGAFLALGHFCLENGAADMVLATLGPVMRLRERKACSTLLWCIERLGRELPGAEPGSFLIAQQLCTVMLAEAVRLRLAEGSACGWLSALGDRRLSLAVAAIHKSPERRWTIRDLAACAGMSRTSFAHRFKAVTGSSPIEHLSRWRMLVACDRLERTADAVGHIAQTMGYSSESAFSHAFKHNVGCSPRAYRQRSTKYQSGNI